MKLIGMSHRSFVTAPNTVSAGSQIVEQRLRLRRRVILPARLGRDPLQQIAVLRRTVILAVQIADQDVRLRTQRAQTGAGPNQFNTMVAQLVGLELTGVGVHRIQRSEFQRNVNHQTRFSDAGRGLRIADGIETLIADVGHDIDRVVHRVNVSFRSDFDLLRRAADNTTEHLSPKSLVRIVF